MIEPGPPIKSFDILPFVSVEPVAKIYRSPKFELPIAIMSSANAALTSTGHFHVLNHNTFSSFVEANRMVLLSVIHPLSPRCGSFIPVFEQVSNKIHSACWC
jgi:hypothetical protein